MKNEVYSDGQQHVFFLKLKSCKYNIKQIR